MLAKLYANTLLASLNNRALMKISITTSTNVDTESGSVRMSTYRYRSSDGPRPSHAGMRPPMHVGGREDSAVVYDSFKRRDSVSPYSAWRYSGGKDPNGPMAF